MDFENNMDENFEFPKEDSREINPIESFFKNLFISYNLSIKEKMKERGIIVGMEDDQLTCEIHKMTEINCSNCKYSNGCAAYSIIQSRTFIQPEFLQNKDKADLWIEKLINVAKEDKNIMERVNFSTFQID